MQTNKCLAINITGPESTGKTLLATQLAEHFNVPIAKDYSREYFAKKTNTNQYKDIIAIAQQQIAGEKEARKNTQTFYVTDTDLINCKIWLTYYNYTVPSFIEAHLNSKAYDLSLLLYPNTKWERDDLRQNPNDRIALFELFQTHLTDYNLPFHILKQLDENRFHQAVNFINNFLKA